MERDIFNINKNQLSYGRGYVYSLQYHLVWCTKYRKKVLKDGIDLECKKMLQDLAEEYRFQILAMEVMPDHIHMLVDCRPQFYISDMLHLFLLAFDIGRYLLTAPVTDCNGTIRRVPQMSSPQFFFQLRMYKEHLTCKIPFHDLDHI